MGLTHGSAWLNPRRLRLSLGLQMEARPQDRHLPPTHSSIRTPATPPCEHPRRLRPPSQASGLSRSIGISSESNPSASALAIHRL